jgi:hypothetical protein
MREFIEPALADIERLNLGNVIAATSEVLENHKVNNGHIRMGLVSGMISSDGPDRIEHHLKRLEYNTQLIRSRLDFPVLSARDIFTDTIYAQLAEMELPAEMREREFVKFWRDLLAIRSSDGKNHFTDLFRTPYDYKSRGARDEQRMARRLGLTFHTTRQIRSELGIILI